MMRKSFLPIIIIVTLLIIPCLHVAFQATPAVTFQYVGLSHQQQKVLGHLIQQSKSNTAITSRISQRCIKDSQLVVVNSVTTIVEEDTDSIGNKKKLPVIVLVAGFESFNRLLYKDAAKELGVIDLRVFSDSEIRISQTVEEMQDNQKKQQQQQQQQKGSNSIGLNDNGINSVLNPIFVNAMKEADAFIGSLIFDYDDVMAVKQVLPFVSGPRMIFESATELMEYNQVGSFSMAKPLDDSDGSLSSSPSGPPPAVKAILSKFGSGKEEDKLAAYIKLLKFGPDLLKYLPGEKISDLRTWLEVYRFWNQGGKKNVKSMLQLLVNRIDMVKTKGSIAAKPTIIAVPEVEVTPDIGLVHPLRDLEIGLTPGVDRYFESSPAMYMKWRLSSKTDDVAKLFNWKLAPKGSPVVAVLLYRKHVVTDLKYIPDLITIMEAQGIIPLPIFINGVEAHTIVRDLLTSQQEIDQVARGEIKRESTYQPSKAAVVDAIVNTVGFPLVGGPAGSMEAGRNVAVAEELLSSMNVPYVVASPLLLQTIPQWKASGVLGLQSVVLYSLPELDGAIDTVVLGGLVGDKIALVPERVRKLTSRIKSWVALRRSKRSDKKIAIALYGFPPNVGAVGTAALLDVPSSLDCLLKRLHEEGYDTGYWASDPDASGESLVAALSVLCENPVITGGASMMQQAVNQKIQRALNGDVSVPATLARPGAGLGGAKVRSRDVTMDELERMLGKYMTKKVLKAWPNIRGSSGAPGISRTGNLVVAGLEIGNVWIFVQPLLGVEGDPMRMLFERDLTPHPQYCATYKYLSQSKYCDGFGANAIIHLGMHGTVEWLPGQPLGNDRQSWSDELLGCVPNIYVYAANNPSESILAKRRGYGTLVSYNVPPYGRAGLYLELANMKDQIEELRSAGTWDVDSCRSIYALAQKSGMLSDVPLPTESLHSSITPDDELTVTMVQSKQFKDWIQQLSNYLNILQDRLFSSGLRTMGSKPKESDLNSYLEAYFGDKLTVDERRKVVSDFLVPKDSQDFFSQLITFAQHLFQFEDQHKEVTANDAVTREAHQIVSLLDRSTEEMDSILVGLDGGYIRPKPGGDLLRDGVSVLPTGRNIHALDPYRMPSASAWARGKRAAEEIIRQHKAANNGNFPETIAVTLWGLDSIKTRGESVAIVLALVGATPEKEGTGRIVRYDLIPLEELGRPRIDVLASMSGIFRDSFANIVDLLDDMFERASRADEPIEMNFVKKHSEELQKEGVTDRTAARLFSNPPGDYGSMVNEVVGSGDWEDSDSLGEIWRGRNVFSYGRNEGSVQSTGTARPEVFDKLLATTERVVQEIDSVEYGLTDIQEYYSNTGALKKAAENRKSLDPLTGKKRKVPISIIEAFRSSGPMGDDKVPVQDIDNVLRMEYRSKLLNPKWRDAMLKQGSGGAYEISQRMTAMVGWAATVEVDNFVFDQAAARYALDEAVSTQLQRSNPEAFKNIVRRLLEANGRGMWDADADTLDKLQDLYSEADDMIETGTGTAIVSKNAELV